MTETLRLMTADDIAAATRLSTEAGWNQTPDDWRMLLELSPQGCIAIEAEGTLAATTTIVCYGRKLAWIGMVLTTARFRGRGFARSLLREALSHAERRQIESVQLDATDQGRPLYETLGFRFQQTVERWTRLGSGALSGNTARPEWPDDTEVFGADRSQLLAKLAARNPPLTQPASYLFTRPGRELSYLGPMVCEGHASARSLLTEDVLQNSGWYWDLLPGNTAATGLARDLAFRPQRRLSRMVRGKDLSGRDEAIYAIAGFELG